MQLLLSGYVNTYSNINDSLDIYTELHHNGRNQFVKANNIRSARQNKIAGTIAICIGVYSLVSLYSSLKATLWDKLYLLTIGCGGYLLIGMYFLFTSYLEKRLPPHHKPLLSERIKDGLKSFLSMLPVLAPMVGIAIAIQFFFGQKILINCIVTFVFLLFPLMLWFVIYSIASWMIKTIKIRYKVAIISIFACIVALVMLVYEIPLIMFLWTHP